LQTVIETGRTFLILVTENPALQKEIAHYLKTGHHDPYHHAWPEGGMLVRAQKMDAVFRNALIEDLHSPPLLLSHSSHF
jgi:hypothetical protein